MAAVVRQKSKLAVPEGAMCESCDQAIERDDSARDVAGGKGFLHERCFLCAVCGESFGQGQMSTSKKQMGKRLPVHTYCNEEKKI